MTELDVSRIRAHFDFPSTGRVVTNNAAGTQPPRELVELYHELAPWYENVRRGQSTAARRTTELFEDAYDTIADWINAPGRRCAPARPARQLPAQLRRLQQRGGRGSRGCGGRR
jgi:cysteine desulfurase/selenocysteine lyase